MWNILFLILCLIFAGMLWVVFKSKETIRSEENKLFSTINLMTITGILIEIILQILTKSIGPDKIITRMFQRIYLVSISAWFTAFSVYTFYILIPMLKKKKDYYKLIRMIHTIVFFILFLLYMVMNIYYYLDGEEMYTFGPAVSLLKITIGMYSGIWIILSIINYKNIIKKSAIPILGIFLLIIANLVLQSINPSLLIVSLTITVVCYLMYFTIENPDLKMVNELYKNKNILEQTYVDKSNFLFEMTQEVRDPMFNIKRICNEVKSSDNIKDYKKAIESINNYSKELDYIVNDILNVNSLDSMQIKFVENKYNLNLIVNEVITQAKEAINKDVKFTYDIDKDIPILYGDSIKIKQIISSLLLDSARRTPEGFIDLRIDTIKRFDALRLVIQIKDSSKGLPIDIVNDILNTTAQLDPKEIELVEKNEINIELCQKIIKLMGGNLLIKSASKKGTETVLTLDQRIDEQRDYSLEYEEYVDKSKKVAIVNQDKKLNEYLKKAFNTNDINPTILLNGLNLIDQIKSGKKYDYIIVANNMKSINGYTILKKLKEIKGFSSPVMIMIERESLKKHLLEEGFDEVMLLEKIEEELNEVINKY